MVGFIIWSIGWLAAYILVARVILNNPKASGEWDNVCRGFCLVISMIFSWAMVIVCLVMLGVQGIIKNKVFSKQVVPLLKKLEPEK